MEAETQAWKGGREWGLTRSPPSLSPLLHFLTAAQRPGGQGSLPILPDPPPWPAFLGGVPDSQKALCLHEGLSAADWEGMGLKGFPFTLGVGMSDSWQLGLQAQSLLLPLK